MKINQLSHRLAAFSLLALAITAAAHAGIVKGVFLSKDRYFIQTSATAVSLVPANDDSMPFVFSAEVDGVDRASIAKLNPPPRIKLPAKSVFSRFITDDGTTTGNPAVPWLGLGTDEDDGWNFGYKGKPEFDNWGTGTKREFDRLFPNGTYVFTVQGKSIKLSLPGDSYAPKPVLVLSGGRWENGTYRIHAAEPLTINSGTYAAYGSHLNDYLGLVMESQSGNLIFERERVAKELPEGPPISEAKTYTRKIAANTLKPGRTYHVFASHTAIVSQSADIPGAICIATYGTSTRVKVIAE